MIGIDIRRDKPAASLASVAKNGEVDLVILEAEDYDQLVEKIDALLDARQEAFGSVAVYMDNEDIEFLERNCA